VLVHGLFGHPQNTWTSKHKSLNDTDEMDGRDFDNQEKLSGVRRLLQGLRLSNHKDRTECLWPADLLPQVFPSARTMTWGYDVDINGFFSSSSGASILQHAETLLSDLRIVRQSDEAQKIPLIFIAHSLGGIVVKEAICLAQDPRYRSELAATHGVMFVGTPHRGSSSASLGKIAFEISRVFLQSPNLKILRSLEPDSDMLERISRQFNTIISTESRIKLHSFREELAYHGTMIVPSASATIGIPVETQGSLYANHRSMARFHSIHEVNFQRVASILTQWIDPLEKQTADNISPEGELIPKNAYESCMASLNVQEARVREREVDESYLGTFSWLFEDRLRFKQFLEGKESSPIYWIQGLPGSGKSTLMKFAISHPTTSKSLSRYSSEPWVRINYFFHDRGTFSAQKSLDGLLREILYQILLQRKDVFPYVYSVYAREFESPIDRKRSGVISRLPWKSEELLAAISLVVTRAQPSFNLCLFVDALDEHDGRHYNLLATLKHITELTETSSFLLRMVVASRPENIFKDRLGECLGFPIHKQTSEDIRKYTEGRIRNESNMVLSQTGSLQFVLLVNEIIDRAQGVFLWVRLVVDEIVEGLREGDTLAEMKELLDTIPTELGDLYHRAILRCRRPSTNRLQQNCAEMYYVYRILLDSPVILSTFTLLASSWYAMSGKSNFLDLKVSSRSQLTSRLYNRSAGLIEEHHMGNRQYPNFIHQSVKEFAISEKGKTLLLEGISDQGSESGAPMLFRFLCYYWTLHFDANGWKWIAGDLDNTYNKHSVFLFHLSWIASAVEEIKETGAKSTLDPFLLAMDENSLYLLLKRTFRASRSDLKSRDIFEVRRDDPVVLQRLLFYALFGLDTSLQESLDNLAMISKSNNSSGDTHSAVGSLFWFKILYASCLLLPRHLRRRESTVLLILSEMRRQHVAEEEGINNNYLATQLDANSQKGFPFNFWLDPILTQDEYLNLAKGNEELWAPVGIQWAEFNLRACRESKELNDVDGLGMEGNDSNQLPFRCTPASEDPRENHANPSETRSSVVDWLTNDSDGGYESWEAMEELSDPPGVASSAPKDDSDEHWD
jgi:Putative serine esterase (DUF676)